MPGEGQFEKSKNFVNAAKNWGNVRIKNGAEIQDGV